MRMRLGHSPEDLWAAVAALRRDARQGANVMRSFNRRTKATTPTAHVPLRVALVIGTLHIGGTETQVCRLARELKDRGHEVRLFLIADGGPLEAELRRAEVPFDFYGFQGLAPYRTGARRHLVQVARSFTPILRFWWDLWRWQPDVCHASLPFACLWSMIGARLVGVPLRIAGRRALTLPSSRSRFNRKLFTCSLRCTHLVAANALAVARTATMVDGISPARIRVIVNGVDLPMRQARPEKQPAEGLMVANLIAYKGHDVVLDALAHLDAPPVLRFAGEGPERSRLEAKVQALGLDDRVVLLGSVPQASTLWEHAQFGVLASFQEGLPNAILEAMSYGVPMVTTAVGGATELVEDGVTGLVVPPGDVVALAKAIATLAGDPALRVRLGEAARIAVQSYSWDRCADAHVDLYESGLTARRRSTRRRRVATAVR